MRKRIADTRSAAPPGESPGGWLELDQIATVEVTSEDPRFPVDSVFTEGGQGWRAVGRAPAPTTGVLTAAPEPQKPIRGGTARRACRARPCDPQWFVGIVEVHGDYRRLASNRKQAGFEMFQTSVEGLQMSWSMRCKTEYPPRVFTACQAALSGRSGLQALGGPQ